MKTIEVLVGISGSGKSSYANKQRNKKEVTILSSDEIREELFGSLMHQSEEDHRKVFEELYNRIKRITSSESDYHIIIDATNLNLKRRVHNYKNTFKDAHVINRIFFVTPKTAWGNILRRGRGDMEDISEVVDRQFSNLQTPIVGVDCDEVVYEGEKFFLGLDKLNNIFALMLDYKGSQLFPVEHSEHDTPYHLEDIPTHIDFTVRLSKLLKNPVLENVALFHDTGKFYCKKFHGEYARFLNHENVSGQIYANVQWMYDKEPNTSVQKGIQLHMMAHDGLSKKIVNRYNLTDEEISDIMKFTEIDRACSINYKHIIEGESNNV